MSKKIKRNYMLYFFIKMIFIVILLNGCGSLPKVKDAAISAVKEPATWVSALGAILVSADNMDHKISEWASRETPVFGSQSSAKEASDYLKTVTSRIYLASIVAMPVGVKDKLKIIAVESLALAPTRTTGAFLKKTVKRWRPNGNNTESFPSGHTISAYGYANMASKNFDSLRIEDSTRLIMQIGTKSIAFATGWARVEAKKHYPSDILAGIAISNFLTSFVHDSFMGLDTNMNIGVELSKNQSMLRLAWSY